ncbi:hypothetical protein M8J77_005252 [Diaphorina citri]|nr:hypothetical protein M8J77_005252 [Diaphorina citri]
MNLRPSLHSPLALCLCLALLPFTCGKVRLRIKGGKGVVKATKFPTTTCLVRPKPTRTTTPECASISLFRYQHLVAANWTTTTTEWSEVSRLKKRIEDKHPRDSIIIDTLRTKFHLMTDKQRFKIEFGRFKRYIIKTGANGTRFLKQFLEISERNLQFEQRVFQIDQILKKWGIPRYKDIHHRFTYITPVNTPPLNYTPTEYYSKWMWFKTSVLDVRYSRFLHKFNNPVNLDDLNIQTTGAWFAAVENMPGYRHHARKFNLGLKHQRKINRTKLYFMKLAEMQRLNLTGDWRSFNGTLIPTSTVYMRYEQPDVMGAINRYFNDCSIGGPDDPWKRWL